MFFGVKETAKSKKKIVKMKNSTNSKTDACNVVFLDAQI